jgi:NADPH:quinone reductase-like Zn-dependent oxidoreductase
LVAGAAGAVGGYIVELAFRRGLTVTGFGRTDDLETIRSLGASEALDELGGHPPFDIAIDTTGNPDQVIDYMADGGKLLTLAGNVTREQRGVTVKAIGVRTNAEALAELSVMAGNRELTLRVAGTFPFDQAAQTHMLLGAGGVRGRLVLHP